MKDRIIEILQGNYTETQTLQIRKEAHQVGQRVNITRLHSRMVRIEIVEPDKVIQACYSIKHLN